MPIIEAQSPAGQIVSVQADTNGNLKILAVPGESTLAVNIANGASITADIDLGTTRLARIAMPAAWDAADLTFQVSFNGAAWADLYDSYGAEYTVTAAASRSIIMPIADFLGIRYLRIRSGKSGSAVNQTAQRTLNLALV